MCCGAVIGLQPQRSPASTQRLSARPRARRIDAAAPAADLDLDQHVDRAAGRDGGRPEHADIARIVDADTDARALRSAPRDFEAPTISFEIGVVDAARDQDRLPSFLAAGADGCARLLRRDQRRFMGLGVRPRRAVCL
jgi:hypothetical protein